MRNLKHHKIRIFYYIICKPWWKNVPQYLLCSLVSRILRIPAFLQLCSWFQNGFIGISYKPPSKKLKAYHVEINRILEQTFLSDWRRFGPGQLRVHKNKKGMIPNEGDLVLIRADNVWPWKGRLIREETYSSNLEIETPRRKWNGNTSGTCNDISTPMYGDAVRFMWGFAS